MIEIKFIVPWDKFEHDVRKIRGNGLKEKLRKQIQKVEVRRWGRGF